MRSSDNKAFKEWAVVCRALGQGKQILILRKGGIAEGPRGFEVTDKQFFLYPTYLHQSTAGVAPAWRDIVTASVDPVPGRVSIVNYAIVVSWLRIRTMDKLQALRGMHIWSDEVVTERFQRWSDEGVFALVVRVYAIPKAVLLPSLESYAGCKSWLTLAEQVPLDGARPVLEDADFERRLAEFKAIAGA